MSTGQAAVGVVLGRLMPYALSQLRCAFVNAAVDDVLGRISDRNIDTKRVVGALQPWQ